MGLLQAVVPSEPLGLSCLQDGKGQVWAGALFWGRTLSPGAPDVILPGSSPQPICSPGGGGGGDRISRQAVPQWSLGR